MLDITGCAGALLSLFAQMESLLHADFMVWTFVKQSGSDTERGYRSLDANVSAH